MKVSPPAGVEEVTVEIGNHYVVIDKLYGSTVAFNLRIHFEASRAEWVIERQWHNKYVEWARIPAQLEDDFGGYGLPCGCWFYPDQDKNKRCAEHYINIGGDPADD
jgi:hypothetical protein